MKRYLGILICLCLLLPFGTRAEGPFTDVFVFGDSLSDTGNLAAANDIFVLGVPIGDNGLCNPLDTIFIPPPFPRRGCDDLFFEESRVSNGPVAVEILAERLGFENLDPSLFFLPAVFPRVVGTNYAVASAKAAGSDLEDLNSQVFGFMVDNNFMAPPDALYVVMIGGNDVIDAVKAAGDLLNGVDLAPEERPKAIIDAAVDAIGDSISDLIDGGAQKILVANSVNIGAVPATRIRAAEEGLSQQLVIATATLLTKKFNRQLAQRLGQIRAEQNVNSVKIKEFNLFRFFETVRFVGKIFRLNIADACFDSDTYRDVSMGIAQRNFHPDCAPDGPEDTPGFDGFLFFDDLHPTGRVHAAIGRAMARAAHRLQTHRRY
jgi:phospholipase/lecithinase/hemolysin